MSRLAPRADAEPGELSVQEWVVAGRLVRRWPVAAAFVIPGVVAVVVGGLVAGAARPSGMAHGSWLAAYLVLVGGVAQLGLGVGQAWLTEIAPPERRVRTELWLWNGGVLVTIAGTLAEVPVVTTVGSLAVGAGAVLFLATVAASPYPARLLRLAHRVLGVLIVVSVPVGIALAWLGTSSAASA